ncbi:HDOD domain-containing protein [Pseudomonas sp. 10B1]|uniref:HDOD domain-containing protein n=1 Tax=unclassified Pseudomonas TaxID=196821 RepID=UPI002AB50C26|nr:MULTISPECIES: HDOD domain-containing protein [unclassified Pseudomonas]MDY7563107.1 HDOD domain-containing protein [Pseudomonas sp. AB6]MEA9978322.1 HDOD domain-containing protein [Pseudomonas sp. RTS4]MEA9993809.1 HDOD domain-containing protein [Pseudomonas sp. AA4]MEB0085150.1 HDOD domain-containing protein [Pseudomonas sp. RTI1]MEB0125253.1 HDOD domain-containing protein [Pseudomonas sp. CCC1.2]
MPPEASAPLPIPRTLDAWHKQLDAIRLPVPIDSHAQVLSALGDNRRSLRDIAELMQESPSLVLSVLREVNHHSMGLSEPAESLEVAINRLGLKRTEELLQRLPALEFEDISPNLRQFQMISQHAMQQANGLFAGRLARLWQDIHWGSLLFLSPLWPMALAHPKLLEEWELRVIHKGESARIVENALFGVSLLKLCQNLAVAWRLPIWVTQGYNALINERRLLVKALHIARDHLNPLHQRQCLDADPALRRWLNQPANTILLANGIALSAQQAWDSPHSLRWQTLTCLYLQISLDELQQQVHQQAVQSARKHYATGLWHPAEALIWPAETRRIHRGMLPAPPPSAEALHQWRKYCTELLEEPSRFNNAMHLTTLARDALVACGMQRVMLLMIDRNMTVLRVHQIAGLEKDAMHLTLDIAQSTVLQRLLAQPTQLRLTPANNAQFSALLPARLKSLFSGDHLLLRSLSSKERVVMLVFADQGGGPLSEISVQAFGKTSQCIERALSSFSNRKV